MKEKINFEELFDELENKNDYENNDNWIFIILMLFLISFSNKKEDKTIININLEGSDVNV